jgi:hypothetical protein
MIRRSLRLALLAGVIAVLGGSCVSAHAAETETARYFETIRSNPSQLLAFLAEMPKGGDLHNHLSGSIYAESFIRWAADKNGCVDPVTYSLSAPPCAAPQVEAAQAFSNPVLYRGMVDAYSMRNWKYSGQSGHDHFFDTFPKFDLAAHNNVGLMLAETAARAASQKEVYQELMFTPTGDAFRSMMASDAVRTSELRENATPETLAAFRKALLANGMPDAVKEAIQAATTAETIRERELKCGTASPDPGCSVTQKYLFQILRGLPKQIVYAQMVLGFELAKADPRFVGLNMVMAEDWYVPMHDFPLHMRMMQYLHKQYPSVHITLHAGELAMGLVPPEGLSFHVRESVEMAGAERIGHGVDVMSETRPNELMAEMAKKNVMVEICLTSNDVILGVGGKEHPLHAYMKAGVAVALATDDEGVSRSDMTHEYLRGAEEQELSYRDLKRMARTSLEHAFVPGASVWANPKTFVAVKQCSFQALGTTAVGACAAFLKANPKAALQWKLESQYREFESRKWPATAGSSKAAAR